MSKVEIVGIDTSYLPKISNAEQLIMLGKIRNGDQKCREDFIYANMRLVLSVIQKYISKKSCNDDVFQVGCIGLIKAIDNFDPRFNVQFSTYACPMIIGEIKRFLRDSNSLRISRSLRDTAYKVLMAHAKLMKQTEREPTIDDIAIELNLPHKLVCFALNATGSLASLDDTVFDEGNKEIVMLDKVANDNDGADNWLENIMLKQAIQALSLREREILVMRYFEGKTQVEVSCEVGISQAQVSRLEKNAIDDIKKRM